MFNRKSNIKKYYYLLKNTDKLWIVSFILVNIAVPICNYVFFLLNNTDMQIEMQKTMYFFLPISSVLTSIFVLEQFYSEKSRDILFFVKIDDRFKYTCFFHILVISNIVFIVLLHGNYIGDIFGFLVKIICICHFYFGLSYFIMFQSKTALSTIMIIILLALFNTIDIFRFKFPLLYETFDKLTIVSFLQIYLPLLFLGIFFLVCVIVKEKKA